MDDLLSSTYLPGLLPNREQSLVLTAALGDESDALSAYQSWRAGLDIAAPFDRQVFRLLPLMYDRLRRLGVDDDLTGRLKGAYRQAWARNHRIMNDVRPALSSLSKSGIRTLILKGAPLALAYYQNVALRPMDDVDIAVRRSDVWKALHTLSEIGFSPSQEISDSTLQYRHSIDLRTADGRQIDLHWDVIAECPDLAGERLFWSDTESIRFLDVETETLKPTWMLLHVIVHGLRWNPEPPVRWIPDAVTLLNKRMHEINWRLLERAAIDFRLNHRLHLGLDYIRQTFSPAVPQSAVISLRRANVDWLQRLEQTTTMADYDVIYKTPLGPAKLVLAEAGRRMHGMSRLESVFFLMDFLRIRWGGGRWSRLIGQLAWGTYTRSLRNPARNLQARLSRGR